MISASKTLLLAVVMLAVVHAGGPVQKIEITGLRGKYKIGGKSCKMESGKSKCQLKGYNGFEVQEQQICESGTNYNRCAHFLGVVTVDKNNNLVYSKKDGVAKQHFIAKGNAWYQEPTQVIGSQANCVPKDAYTNVASQQPGTADFKVTYGRRNKVVVTADCSKVTKPKFGTLDITGTGFIVNNNEGKPAVSGIYAPGTVFTVTKPQYQAGTITIVEGKIATINDSFLKPEEKEEPEKYVHEVELEYIRNVDGGSDEDGNKFITLVTFTGHKEGKNPAPITVVHGEKTTHEFNLDIYKPINEVDGYEVKAVCGGAQKAKNDEKTDVPAKTDDNEDKDSEAKKTDDKNLFAVEYLDKDGQIVNDEDGKPVDRITEAVKTVRISGATQYCIALVFALFFFMF